MMKERLKDLIQKERDAISSIPITDDYELAIEVIFEHIHKKGGTLICSGMGKAGQIALNISTTFSSTGTPSVFLHPSEAQHGDLGILRSNDVLLLVSNSGKTREILELVNLSRSLHPTIKIIAITKNYNSSLGKESDITIITGNTQEVCPLGLTPTISTTVMTVIGDLLVVSMMEKIGFTKLEYFKRHHGGYLGKQSKNNND